MSDKHKNPVKAEDDERNSKSTPYDTYFKNIEEKFRDIKQ